MVDVVINYDNDADSFKVYEPKTDTIIVTKNLTEALLNLSKLLESLGINIFGEEKKDGDVTYHLDSKTLKTMIESNVNLLKKISASNTPLSGFTISERKFGTNKTKEQNFSKGFKGSGFRKSKLGNNNSF